MVGRGGALPRCCAPPHEQIFDIPALSRGGGARSVKFPPPSGLIGLCFRGWGQASKTVQFRDLQLSPNTRSKGEPWSPEDAGRIVYFQFSPRRRAWRESLPIRAPQSLYPSSGDAMRDQWARSRRLPPPPPLFHSLHCPKFRMQRSAFPKARGAASTSVSARAWQPQVRQPSQGWSSFFPPDSYLVSQSYKRENWGKSGAA